MTTTHTSAPVSIPATPAPVAETPPTPPTPPTPTPPTPPTIAKPRYRANPPPDYPRQSQREGEEGTVLLDVEVRADGTPAAVSLHTSCGHPLLDAAAIDAVHHWAFEPGRVDGEPVASRVVVPVRFSLDSQ